MVGSAWPPAIDASSAGSLVGLSTLCVVDSLWCPADELFLVRRNLHPPPLFRSPMWTDKQSENITLRILRNAIGKNYTSVGSSGKYIDNLIQVTYSYY